MRRLVPTLAIGVIASTSACGAAAVSTCAELEAELAEFEPTAAQAWEDIASLQESVSRAQQLRDEIAERC